METKKYNLVENALDGFTNAQKILRETCIDYLASALAQAENNRIDLMEDCDVMVSYDGGRHPEYDSNMYSNLYAVYLKDGEIYLDIEDTNEYSIDRVSTDDIHSVCEGVHLTMEYDGEGDNV